MLPIVVAVTALIPIGARIAGILEGTRMIDGTAASAPIDSHFRYLSGLLLAVGVAYWTTIPTIERSGARFRLLTAMVVVGGVGRFVALVSRGGGVPDLPMLLALGVELGVAPLCALWQWRIAER